MKKYNLSAEFVKWEGTSETSSEADSFDYVIEFESEEEAKIRLEALIIDKMSSRPGWSFKLVDSKISEFPISDEKNITLLVDEQSTLSEQPSMTDQTSSEPLPEISEQPEVPNVNPPDDINPPDEIVV
jgi:hypothetical protein